MLTVDPLAEYLTALAHEEAEEQRLLARAAASVHDPREVARLTAQSSVHARAASALAFIITSRKVQVVL